MQIHCTPHRQQQIGRIFRNLRTNQGVFITQLQVGTGQGSGGVFWVTLFVVGLTKDVVIDRNRPRRIGITAQATITVDVTILGSDRLLRFGAELEFRQVFCNGYCCIERHEGGDCTFLGISSDHIQPRHHPSQTVSLDTKNPKRLRYKRLGVGRCGRKCETEVQDTFWGNRIHHGFLVTRPPSLVRPSPEGLE